MWWSFGVLAQSSELLILPKTILIFFFLLLIFYGLQPHFCVFAWVGFFFFLIFSASGVIVNSSSAAPIIQTHQCKKKSVAAFIPPLATFCLSSQTLHPPLFPLNTCRGETLQTGRWTRRSWNKTKIAGFLSAWMCKCLGVHVCLFEKQSETLLLLLVVLLCYYSY